MGLASNPSCRRAGAGAWPSLHEETRPQSSSEGRELIQFKTPHGQRAVIQQKAPTQTWLYHTGGWSDTQQTHLSHRGENASPAPAWGVDETPGVQGPMGARTRPPKVWTDAWISVLTKEVARPGSPQTRAGPGPSISTHLPRPLALMSGRDSSLWVARQEGAYPPGLRAPQL